MSNRHFLKLFAYKQTFYVCIFNQLFSCCFFIVSWSAWNWQANENNVKKFVKLNHILFKRANFGNYMNLKILDYWNLIRFNRTAFVISARKFEFCQIFWPFILNGLIFLQKSSTLTWFFICWKFLEQKSRQHFWYLSAFLSSFIFHENFYFRLYYLNINLNHSFSALNY